MSNAMIQRNKQNYPGKESEHDRTYYHQKEANDRSMHPHLLQQRRIHHHRRPHQSRQGRVRKDAGSKVGSRSRTECSNHRFVSERLTHRRLADNTRDEDSRGEVVEHDASETRQEIEQKGDWQVSPTHHWRNDMLGKYIGDGGREMIIGSTFDQNKHGEKEQRDLPRQGLGDRPNRSQTLPVEDAVLDQRDRKNKHRDMPKLDRWPAIADGRRAEEQTEKKQKNK